MFNSIKQQDVAAVATVDEEDCRRENERVDRRQKHFSSLYHSLFKRQRQEIRRDDDGAHIVDLHEPKLVGVVIAIILLCVTDAFMTMGILADGGKELNPLMDVLIQDNLVLFFLVKYIMTAACLIFTLAHKHFTLFKVIHGYHIIYGVFAIYSTLVIYEIVIVNFL